ncbi:MAG: MarR family winged helix-turn-helix transcriptional regulator [Pseudomonadota bacterium]
MDPDDVALFCFGHRSRRAAQAVTRAFNQRLKPLGLQITQFILLGLISRQGDRSIAALADEVGVEPSAVLRNLKVLEDRGLVAVSGGRGRGGCRLRATDAGRALILGSLPAWRRAQTDLAALLEGRAEETRAALVRLERAALALERAEK